MHTFSETGTNSGVPAFLAKLWRLVEDPSTDNLISWSPDGGSFIIQNQAQFARELLPLNYKHNNMASFIRQLNMYGFHKITSIDNGGLKFDRDEMEFSHSFFQRGYPYLLEHIKRKIANPKQTDEKGVFKPEAVSKVLNEVKQMRGRQDSLDTRFSSMKQENEALWKEIAMLRQKHMKQQQMVNKLIQFLVTIVQPQCSGLGGGMVGVKRRIQLMINDAPQGAKMRRTNDDDSGPVIRELGEELLDDIRDSDSENVMTPKVQSPKNELKTERLLKSNDVDDSYLDYDDDDEDEDDDNLQQQQLLTQQSQPIKYNYTPADRLIIKQESKQKQQRQQKQQKKQQRQIPPSQNNDLDDYYVDEDDDVDDDVEQQQNINNQSQFNNDNVDDNDDDVPIEIDENDYKYIEEMSSDPVFIDDINSHNTNYNNIINIGNVDDDNNFINSTNNVITTPLVKKELLLQQQQQQQQQYLRRNKKRSNNNNNSGNSKEQLINNFNNNNNIDNKKNIIKITTNQNNNINNNNSNNVRNTKSLLKKKEQQQQLQQQQQNKKDIKNNIIKLSATSKNNNNNQVNNGRSSGSGNVGVISGGNSKLNSNIKIMDKTTPMYINQVDFINAEMPHELFDDDDNDDDNKKTNKESPLIGGGGGGGSGSGIRLNDNNNDLFNQQQSTIDTIATTSQSPSTSTASTMMIGGGGGGGKNINNKNLVKNDWALSKMSKNNEVLKLSSPADIDQHLESFQGELDTLKDLLRGEGIAVDPNTLLGETSGGKSTKTPKLIQSPYIDFDHFVKLFADSDVLSPYTMSMPDKKYDDPSSSSYGSELMAYNPQTSVDLFDMLNDSNSGMDHDIDEQQQHQQPKTPDNVLNTPYYDKEIIFNTKTTQ